MLAELRLEREQIEEAILTLERLARGRGRRRGRPPSWLKDAAAGTLSLDENGEVTSMSGRAQAPRPSAGKPAEGPRGRSRRLILRSYGFRAARQRLYYRSAAHTDARIQQRV